MLSTGEMLEMYSLLFDFMFFSDTLKVVRIMTCKKENTQATLC